MSEAETVKELVHKRGQIKSYMTRCANYFNNLAEPANHLEVRARLDKLEPKFNEFENVQSTLEITDTKTNIDLHNAEREAFEAQYFNLIAIGEGILRAANRAEVRADRNRSSLARDVTSDNSNNGNGNNIHVKLPTLNLPTFNGQYDQWLTFHDTFNSLINQNDQLSEIQKFHYLKSSLIGEASHAISSLAVTANNYSNAWELLRARFENKRLIVKNHINALYNMPSLSTGNSSSLRKLLDVLNTNLRALKSMNLPVDSWDILLIYLIQQRFDYDTNKEWESQTFNTDLPTMSEMIQFLINRSNMWEAITNQKAKMPYIPKTKSFTHATFKGKTNLCNYCKGTHQIYHCPEFLNLTPEARLNYVKENNMCTNCLLSNHKINNCKNEYSCKQCKKRHNTLLHISQNIQNTQNDNLNQNREISHAMHISADKQILLSTAVVYVVDKFGNNHDCRALLDVGAQSNFISDRLCSKLSLTTTNVNISITGVNDATPTHVSKSSRVTFRSRTTAFTAQINCLVVPKVTNQLPPTSFDISNLNIPQNFILADPSFNKSGPIDMLIGAEMFYKLMCKGQFSLGRQNPDLKKTHLGWVIGGPLPVSQSRQLSCHHQTVKPIEDELRKFWEIEEVELNSPVPESKTEIHFLQTHSRQNDGRFIVRLPFSDNLKPLGDSRQLALKRFYSLERKFNNNQPLRDSYTNFMKEYLELGHMEPVNDKISTNNMYYLPHHAVFKNDSLSKIRVVFDASAKTTSGVSLNDNLLVGPTLQQDLFNILVRFRTHVHAMTADITKMYRQIVLHPSDRDFHRILWRDNHDEQIQTFRLTTVTYGTSSAPFTAVRCLQQAAHDVDNLSPAVRTIMLEDFYVDDLLTGADSISELIQVRTDLVRVLSNSGFELCKFATNCKDLEHDRDKININSNSSEQVKTLGLLWNCNLDTFTFTTKLVNNGKFTKRSILSSIAAIFDPLGLIGPVITIAKLIMQRLWVYKLEWDEPVPIDIHNDWKGFIEGASLLEQFHVKRRVIPNDNIVHIELHGFCDSSQVAYGACIYIKCIDNSGNKHVNILCSKSRVAPIKPTTIPRLELCGALLLARLMKKTINSLRRPIHSYYFWTDSTIVLAWINSDSTNLKTFVSNRIHEIQTLSNPSQWNHVSSKDNPADIISRGMCARELANSKLWHHGPEWLMCESSKWPSTNIINDEIPEQRNHLVAVIINPNQIINKFSNLSKLIRITALLFRFKYNCKHRQNKLTEPITVTEYREAKFRILSLVQGEAFASEIKHIKSNGKLPTNSSILALNPYIDDNGLLRVGGRLQNASIPYTQKHPIILPKNSHITNLIISEFHTNNLHAGQQLTLAATRQEYWPLSGRSAVRGVLHRCVTCFRANPKSSTQLMGNLPRHRVEPARPFAHCGVDYAGPISLREGRGRGNRTSKAYVALFICFATRAIHIELVCDLTSISFLNALKRFISRRGMVSHIYSDNATTFVGADSILNDLRSLFNSNSFKNMVINHLTSKNITWHFIPARSPHFGGLWESGIKSAKHHLKRIVGDAALNYDELYTVLTRIESCLNSRPLIPISDNSDDLNYLTPGHFLIGESLTAPLEENVLELNPNRLTRWQRVQQISQHFWKRWTAEYLGQLQIRGKWAKSNNIQLSPGLMVILREDNQFPLQWKLGRIVETHPGSDGIIRVVSVKTLHGVVKRAVAKICVLPNQ